MEPASHHESLPGDIQIVRWPHAHPLAEEDVIGFFNARGLRHTSWSNEPGEVYAVHAHSYRKILFCLEGSILFSLPDIEQEVRLRPGDRLIIPAHTPHSAVVGPEGVTCIEAGEEHQ